MRFCCRDPLPVSSLTEPQDQQQDPALGLVLPVSTGLLGNGGRSEDCEAGYSSIDFLANAALQRDMLLLTFPGGFLADPSVADSNQA